MLPKNFFIRNIEAEDYLENFLVSAIVSIFLIRIFLKLAHYPHLGSGDFHIAHMLWGGFFMLAAIILLLSFLSKTSANIASILAGIGFGTFIDEFGKFVTSDNNYFFQPTVAFIYIIFVLVFLITRFIPRYRRITKREYLVNAIEVIKESAINDFDVEDEKRAKEYLRKCDANDPTVRALKKLLSQIDATPIPDPSVFTSVRKFVRNQYYKIARSGFILNVVIIYLIFQTLRTISQTVTLFMLHPVLPFAEWGKLYSSILAGVFVLFGLFSLRFSKVEAYRFFRIAIMITLLLTEFFAFVHTQWYEFIILLANIFIFLVINYARVREIQKAKLSVRT